MTRLSNDLADWYPVLAATGAPTPRTEIVRTDVDLTALLHAVSPDGLSDLVGQVTDAAGRIGFPAFLRTGHTSGKHDFARTAFLRSPADVLPHISALVEVSALATDDGLPTDTWVVREFLPIQPAFLAFRGLPVTAERRYYFNALGQVTGHHPYWSPQALADGHPRGPRGPLAVGDWRQALDVLNTEGEEEVAHLSALTAHIADAFRYQGAWSVDYLYTLDRGWVVIDMARFEDTDVWHEHPTAPFTLRRPLPDGPAQGPGAGGPAGPVEAAVLAQMGLSAA